MKIENSIVKKNNRLISSQMKNYSLVQIKILNFAISQLTQETHEGAILNFNVADILEATGLGDKNHKELRKATLNMIRGVEIIEDDGISQVAIFQEIKYHDGGTLTIEFHKKVLPLLIQAKTAYTRYYFLNIQRLKSKYSIRIYELCKQYENVNCGYREFKIDELKIYLDIDKYTYQRYGHFKQGVLDSSIKEISEKTDIKLNYETFKNGRKIDRIRFYIVTQKNKNTNNLIIEENIKSIYNNTSGTIEKEPEIKKTIIIKQEQKINEEDLLTEAGKKLLEDFLMPAKISLDLQNLAITDECLLYAIDKYKAKLDLQIKKGNKPDNLARYSEIALRESIPIILSSGIIEKEKEKAREQELTKELETIRLKKEYEKKKKEEYLKLNFHNFCKNPDLLSILENADIHSLLISNKSETELNILKYAQKECNQAFECDVENITAKQVYLTLTDKIEKNSFMSLLFKGKAMNLKNYLKHSLRTLF